MLKFAGNTLMLLICFFLVGCGLDNTKCKDACLANKEKIESTLGEVVDCNHTKWTSAQTCAECVKALEELHDTTVTNPASFCGPDFE